MQPDNDTSRRQRSRDLLELMIRFGLIATVFFFCVRIISPFATLMVWALILAVSLYPLHQRVAKRLGGRQGRSATLIIIAGMLLIAVPTVSLVNSFVDQAQTLHGIIKTNDLTIKHPDPSIAQWPVIGEKVYAAWSAAADDLLPFLEKIQPQLIELSRSVLSRASGLAGSILVFFISMIIAGVMMAYGESGDQVIRRIQVRLSGPDKGPRLHDLTTATIRSVATGVIGVAFIQAILLGVGFVLADIPAAGVLALVALLFGIAQLPLALISLPAIAYVWWAGDVSTTINVILTIYLVVVSLVDNLLKPILLGRGVDAPMPVILLGALGGMVFAGIIGLFIGAVLLAVGYKLFMEWVDEAADESSVGKAQDLAPPDSE